MQSTPRKWRPFDRPIPFKDPLRPAESNHCARHREACSHRTQKSTCRRHARTTPQNLPYTTARVAARTRVHFLRVAAWRVPSGRNMKQRRRQRQSTEGRTGPGARQRQASCAGIPLTAIEVPAMAAAPSRFAAASARRRARRIPFMPPRSRTMIIDARRCVRAGEIRVDQNTRA